MIFEVCSSLRISLMLYMRLRIINVYRVGSYMGHFLNNMCFIVMLVLHVLHIGAVAQLDTWGP